uniref:Uncharacterized protein n=1 Tax=Faxonius propinquus nudivirus TaxID=3139431 RepID=A0AAU8GF45_9VIRU
MNKNIYSDKLKDALNLNTVTKQQIMETEIINKNTTTTETDDKYSKFLYPTLIMIPLIIIFLSILVSSITTLSKIFILLLLLIVIVCYILQTKSVNLYEQYNKIMNKKK